MHITKLDREITHRINVGGYESIVPTLRLEATVDPGESFEQVRRDLDAIATQEFNKLALAELRMVHKRRAGLAPEDDRVPHLLAYFKSCLG